MTKSGKTARIALTMPRLSRYGGAESFAWRLAETLAARGHAVDFICARCETEPPPGVNPMVVGRFGGLRVIKVLWFALMADRMTRKGGYDLVFGMGNTVNQDILRVGGGSQSVFWKLSKRAWPQGFARFFKMFRRRCAPANWAIHLLDVARMKRTPKIVAVSNLVRDWIIEAHPHLNIDDIDVIYNRPDLDRFAFPSHEERASLRQAAGVGPGQVVIGTAATNFALKGIRHLVTALTYLPDNYVLHVAGGRNPSAYKLLARSLGVESRVRFFGKVDDMPSFYRTLDVFVLATFYDACSNAVLEALACGCRVVSSALNGSACFLPERCVISDPDDISALAEALLCAGREDVPPPFAWPEDVVSGIDPYVELVEGMLDRK